MTSRVQTQRSNVTGARPSGRPPGELYVNWADLQLGVISPADLPVDLIAVRYFSAAAEYVINQIVSYNGGLYAALGTISPGPFNPAQWSAFGSGGSGSAGIGEAPLDGQTYGRSNARWVIVTGGGGGGGIGEAPINGQLYGRMNALWQVIPAGTGGGISDAPNDGTIYGRKNLAWAAIPSGSGGGITDAPNDGTSYARNSLGWVHLTHNDITDWASQLSAYATTASVTTQLGNYLPLAGGICAGSVTVTQKGGTAAALGGGFRVNATGSAVYAGTFSASSADIILSKANDTSLCQIAGANNGLLRWQMFLGGPESESGGGNSGSGFVLGRCSNAGTSIDSPIQVSRGSGATTFSVAIINGPSDRRLKENIAPIEDALSKVLALQGVSFNRTDGDKHPEIGLIAQDVAPVVPEIIQEFRKEAGGEQYMALDYPRLTALLIEAVKTLTQRVAALEGRT